MLEHTFTIRQAIEVILLCLFVVAPAMIGWAVILGFIQQQRAKPDKPMASR